MGIFRSANGMIKVELTSAEPHRSIWLMGEAGVRLYQVSTVDEFTFSMELRRQDYKKVQHLAEKNGDTLRIVGRTGVYWALNGLKRRPVLVLGAILLILLTVALPRCVLFVQVEGNVTVPERLVIEKASECGIVFGADRESVRSEKLKNALLSAIPQLQWAGINTRGCVAVITVREKTAVEIQPPPQVSRIVAVRDAVVVSCTAEQGNLLCKPGQVVKAGDLLISGYTDCGLTIKATRSVGEIYGQTNRSFSAVLPEEYVYRRGMDGQTEKYALIIGKKRINFYKDSGILGGTCGKMSTVNYMTLPGGFYLPIALVKEVWTSYDCKTDPVPADLAEQMLDDFSSDYLSRQMLAGKVLRRQRQCNCANGVYTFQGEFSCLEMIGREQSEETLDNYGKSD